MCWSPILPTKDGTAATAGHGSLLMINNRGKLIQSFTGADIQGPWDAAMVDGGNLAAVFIANALNGTVSRLDFIVSSSGLKLLSSATIASGYMHQPDPAALFDAPTGLVYDLRRDTLFVASTLDNEIFAVRSALERNGSDGPGTVIYHDNTHLHGALAMAGAPNDHLLVTNNDVINEIRISPAKLSSSRKTDNSSRRSLLTRTRADRSVWPLTQVRQQRSSAPWMTTPQPSRSGLSITSR